MGVSKRSECRIEKSVQGSECKRIVSERQSSSSAGIRAKGTGSITERNNKST